MIIKKKLKKIYKKYVDKEYKKKINYNKSFAELGIDSLKSVQLITEIEKSLIYILRIKILMKKLLKFLENLKKIIKIINK